MQNTQFEIPEWHLPPAPPTDAHLRLLARMADMRPAFEQKVKEAEVLLKAREELQRAQLAAQAQASAAAQASVAAQAEGDAEGDAQAKAEGDTTGPQAISGPELEAAEGDALCQVSGAKAEAKGIASAPAAGDDGAAAEGPRPTAPSEGGNRAAASGDDEAPSAAPSQRQSEPGSDWALETTKEALEDALGEWPDPDPQVRGSLFC